MYFPCRSCDRFVLFRGKREQHMCGEVVSVCGVFVRVSERWVVCVSGGERLLLCFNQFSSVRVNLF